MLTITEPAWARLSELSRRINVVTMRLTHRGGRVKCRRGVERARDEVIALPGRPKVLMTPTVAEALASGVLDAP
jgi:hypothetical protein